MITGVFEHLQDASIWTSLLDREWGLFRELNQDMSNGTLSVREIELSELNWEAKEKAGQLQLMSGM